MVDADPDPDRFGSRRSTVHAPRGAVATSQPLAARAGLSVLESGGNAFDAAVATAAALNVVEPTSTGLGGDVFALYRTADGQIGAMRACGGAPEAATLSAVREAVADDGPGDADSGGGDAGSDGDGPEMPFRGPHTVTVPGTARGWERTVERLGTMSLSTLLEPAIEYATDGFPVSELIAGHWAAAEDLFDEAGRAAYLVDGERAPRPGERVRLPELGESLRRVAEDGADVVYEGAIADRIVDTVREAGGLLSRSDMAGFEVEFLDPISTAYRGHEVYELPPNNQGPLALAALNVAEELDAGARPPDDPEGIHRYVEATKLAFRDGHRHVTDPDHEGVPDLTSADYARRRAAEVRSDGRAIQDPPLDPTFAGEDADTVLLTVGDDRGNLVSYINSRFAGFGSGLVADGTGIALQNRGASFSLDPEHPNRIAPGKRPFHTLIPALARLGEDDWAAFGVMGGYMQPQGHLQLLANLIDHGMALQAALDRPRWRHREDGTLGVEERLPDPLATKLARRGHDVRVLPPSLFGGAQIVRRRGEVVSAATDPRKDGVAIGL